MIGQMHMKDVAIAYGMTESSPLTTFTRIGTPLEQRVGTVGTVMPHEELKIVNPVTGKTAQRGVAGEICVRGYMVMAGYDDNPDATRNAIDDNRWLHTGDIGTMDDAGFVRITGRMKDMVIRGGENIYPREIEEFLHRLDVIEDAQVVGVPDEKYGEELLACVRLRRDGAGRPVRVPSEEEFRELCRQHIAHYKVPRYWMVVDEFPMTVSGKVQKFKIRESAIRKLGLAPGAVTTSA